jgi:hypothetical protein
LQLIERAEGETGQVLRLVGQHLRFVLQLLDLVVDLLQSTGSGQDVLYQVGRIDDHHRRLYRGHYGHEYGSGDGNQGFLHGCFS